MKKIYFLLLICLITNYAHAISGLIANYPLTSNGVDITGNNDTINRINAPFQNGGIYCNGDLPSMVMRTPQINGFSFTSFSISFDFNADEYSTRPVIMCGSSYRWLGLYLDTNGTIKLKYNNDNFETSSVPYTPHNWHSAYLNYDGVTVKLYLDGVEAISKAVTFVYVATDTEIGAVDYGTARGFKGLIKNLKITNSPQPQYFNYNTNGSNNSFPFNITAGKEIQLLYLPGDFNQPTIAPAGNITSLSFRIGDTYALGPWAYTDFTIKIGQSNDTTFGLGSLYTGTLITVYYRASVTLTGTAGGWMTITLDTPFNYDPTQSLIVDIGQCSVPGGTGFSACFTTLTNMRRNWSSGGCPFAFGGQNNAVYHMGLSITCVPPPAPTNTTPIANTTVCAGTSAVLNASGTGTLGWYDQATGGTYLGGGSNYITPGLLADVIYYVQDSTCDASTSRTAISVSMIPAPTPNLYSLPLISRESFENSGAVPSGWEVENISGGNSITFVTSTTWPSGYIAYDNTYLVMFNSFSVSAGVVRLKKTIPVSTIGLTNVSVGFSWLESNGYNGVLDRVEVEWSTDGTTWLSAGTFNRYNAIQGWKDKSQALPSGAQGQATLYIAFKFTSEYGNDCYLDLARITALSSMLCEGSSATYITEAGEIGYSWDVSAGGTITSGGATNSVSVLWGSAGPQTVSVSYVNTDGCLSIIPTVSDINVAARPIPTVSGPASSCINSTDNIYATELGMSAYNWTISPGGTITAGAGTEQINVDWNTVGIQNVFVIYQNIYGCVPLGPTTYNCSVSELPITPVISMRNDTLFSNASSGNQWYSLTTGLLPGSNGTWFIPITNGIYYDIVTINSCNSDTSNKITITNVSVSDYSRQNEISVYPNPAGDFVFIEKADASKANIELFDISGKSVLYNEIINSLSKVNISNLPAGIYTLRINSSYITKVVKIIKM